MTATKIVRAAKATTFETEACAIAAIAKAPEGRTYKVHPQRFGTGFWVEVVCARGPRSALSI